MKDIPKAIAVTAVCIASLGGVWITKDPSALAGLIAAVLITNNW